MVGISEALRGELYESDIELSVVMPAIVRTELTDGVQEVRGVKSVTPEEVADEIVSAIEKPRFDVYVPRSAGWVGAAIRPLPRRVREGLGRAMKLDKIMIDVDQEARSGYENRAAQSTADDKAEEEVSTRQ